MGPTLKPKRVGPPVGNTIEALYGLIKSIKTHKTGYPIGPVASDPINILQNMQRRAWWRFLKNTYGSVAITLLQRTPVTDAQRIEENKAVRATEQNHHW